MVRTGGVRSPFDRLRDEMEVNSSGFGGGGGGRGGWGGELAHLGAELHAAHLSFPTSCKGRHVSPSSRRLTGPRERSAGTPQLLTREAALRRCGGVGGGPLTPQPW